jgi:uncharacterized protein (DUF952 family)
MAIVLHLIAASAWQDLAADAPVTNPSLEREGFIHCTDDADVMLGVANAFYRDVPGGFVVLHVDTERLTSECVWEDPAHPRPGDRPALAPKFPHIYGPIDRAAIIGVQTVDRAADGAFTGYGAAIS